MQNQEKAKPNHEETPEGTKRSIANDQIQTELRRIVKP